MPPPTGQSLCPHPHDHKPNGGGDFGTGDDQRSRRIIADGCCEPARETAVWTSRRLRFLQCREAGRSGVSKLLLKVEVMVRNCMKSINRPVRKRRLSAGFREIRNLAGWPWPLMCITWALRPCGTAVLTESGAPATLPLVKAVLSRHRQTQTIIAVLLFAGGVRSRDRAGQGCEVVGCGSVG